MGDIPLSKPVFFKADLFGKKQISIFDICSAAEKTTGIGSIFGCQKVGGVHRLYPKTDLARAKLLSTGFELGGITILPNAVSPSKTYTRNGIEIPTTRLSVSNIFLSVSDTDITNAVKSAGYTTVSPPSLVCARDASGKLSNFRTGTRSFIIEVPTKPLPKTVTVQSKFTAYLFYPRREQIEANFTLSDSSNTKQSAVETTRVLSIESEPTYRGERYKHNTRKT